MPSIELFLDSPNSVFFPGQTITGRVQVVCQKPTAIQGINIKFLGFSRVHWEGIKTTVTVTHFNGVSETTDKTKYYKHFKEYYVSDILLRGNDSSVVVLPPGDHVYNFSYDLPEQIPSSFETDIGQVRHQCQAVLITSNREQIDCHKSYLVNVLYDLNLDFAAKVPIIVDAFKTLYFLCCICGPISLVLRVNRSGFVPGENLYINAECTNKSKILVRSSKVKIIQVMSYIGLKFKGDKRLIGDKQRKETKIIAKMKHGQIPPGESDTWKNEGLLIPATHPSHFKFCQHIDIQYFLEFSVVTSGPTSDLKVLVPVIIGSIPLLQNSDMLEPSPSTSFTLGLQNPSESYDTNFPPSAPPTVGCTSSGFNQNPDMPPPSYAESMYSAPQQMNKDKVEHDNPSFNP